MIIDQHADQRLMHRVESLRRRWTFIVEAALVCALGAWIVSSYLPRVYRATTYILISESKIGESSRDSNVQQMAMLPTFIPFLDNDGLIHESMKRFNLDKPPYQMTVSQFRNGHLDIRVPKSTRLLEVNVEFPDPELSAQLANDIAQSAVRFNDRLNATDTTASREFLKRHLDQVTEGLSQAAERKLRIQEEARLEGREKDLAVLLEEKDALHAHVHMLRLELAQNDVRAKSLESVLQGEPETVVLRKSIASDRYLELLTQKMGIDADALAITEESINQIRESFRKDYLNVTISTAAQKTGVDAATQRLAVLDREISAAVRQLVSLRSQVAAAEQEYNLAVQAVSGASREYEAASVTVSAKSQDMKQIAPAMPPERPVRPKPLINALAGLVFGAVAFGGGMLAVQSYRDFQHRGES